MKKIKTKKKVISIAAVLLATLITITAVYINSMPKIGGEDYSSDRTKVINFIDY